ncbi:zinc finger and SCAN domain-containing protein 26 isoform X1 [Aotus nancymaae]|uniref:Zinc finger and SCAN domain-containing protein 26 n=1 Tax=Aotus nancymaae TaxID=37293 RepID=A0A2K5DEE0_AOTNA|nr:zinc finger and SCAN domain-containing protein 26 isoform X1 [Aotus nancymaae]XP_012321260.1 zinc finger and SCAN domain-containing protein 26 isoform X1 [Aotus nancymaae]XP_012321261.1 zinc finger and SCAN domain-containing protein 26 isoform X1 [Aotus nancymaae]
MAIALVSAHSLAPLTLKKEGLQVVREDHYSTWEEGFKLQRNSEGLGQEPLCKQFRQLHYEETTGPREALSRLRELYQQWLQPETHTKEQILELLVLEQFLTILPEELQARVQEHHPESGEDVVVVLKDLQLDLGETGQQVDPDQAKKQKMLVEEIAPLRGLQEQQVRPECEVTKPEKEKGEETRIENGKLVVVTDSYGRVESSGKISEPMEAHNEGSNLERQQAKPKEKTDCKCSECGQGFFQHADLSEHASTHAGKKLCESDVCQTSSLTGHQKVLSREKGHRCHECGKTFQRSSHLVRHQKIHLGEKPYQCNECGKVFSQNAGLLEHLRIHTGERPYLCIHCGKNFRRSSHLNRHQRIHSQEEPCECKECGKTFSQALLLTHHQRIHSHSKSHQCNECGKAFSLTSDLIRHHRIHTGEKPFKCNICQKAFRLNSHLAQHVRIHNEEKPYLCSQCGEAFRQRSGLFQHQRYHHKDKLA